MYLEALTTKISKAWHRGYQQLAWWLTPENLTQLRPQVKFQAGVLAGFALCASLLLGLADFATRDSIKLRLEEDLKASLEEVVPADQYDNDLLASSMTVASSNANLGVAQTVVYLAKQQSQVTAVCFKFIAPDGYSGKIHLVMGINQHGKILGVRVISHAETPGLGDKIELTKTKWILGFNGKSLDNLTVSEWAVKKDGGVFDQFAGATITPRAIVNAIKRGLDFFQAHRQELIASDLPAQTRE